MARPYDANNIFTAVRTQTPEVPFSISARPDHPVPRKGISLAPPTKYPIPTNKFYANLYLGNQNQAVWTHPYSVWWPKGAGNSGTWGLAIAHIERTMLAYGSTNRSGSAQSFINPTGIQSMALSAAELGSSTALTTDTLRAFSVNCNLSPSAGAPPILTFPLCQGMGFLTGLYTSCTPLIQSGVFLRSFATSGSVNGGQTLKYRANLEDNTTWLIYVTPAPGVGYPQCNQQSNTTVRGTAGFTGIIQVAKLPQGGPEMVYDNAAGAFAVTADLSATISGEVSSYTLAWQKAGNFRNKPLLIFALPHHIATFDSATAAAKTALQLQTTTKGVATGVYANSWTMVESKLPLNMKFAPWSNGISADTLPATAISAINTVAEGEINQDFNAQTNLDSMYFSGKGLCKFAMAIYVINDLAKNPSLAQRGLTKLKAAIARFITNTQRSPLAYESDWGGVVSTAGLGGNDSADFGNSFYNDHHFHFGYFVYTAAVITYLDPAWLNQGSNRNWIDMLVRDYANPVEDNLFPFYRSFDWFCGHSWAKGLYESADGKDEESTSEDSFSTYALKMWGIATGDKNMENRANLMLSIQARSFQNYFLMESTNKNQPPNYIGNKAPGILFENKVDFATYFGTNIEYVTGIQMIPLAPPSALVRTKNFVSEEWKTYFDNGRVDQIQGGWRGICYANFAIIDPKAAFAFFTRSNFDASLIDPGASRTWYIAYCAGLGGA
ncbi:glycoside hydrolase family 81 protein [Aulographum hederae CBS 113979]|uniref:glucan endo-1,3-beta-D-glucosidase n=1 Tax=Aulographum hederae CBS 113979 TaxID=1176131 RepID=A0A6G1HF52_9PEZI|nr:glycoside hydrolase family 81 protein [Aulographum hederae CBS 113979]